MMFFNTLSFDYFCKLTNIKEVSESKNRSPLSMLGASLAEGEAGCILPKIHDYCKDVPAEANLFLKQPCE